MLIFLKQMFIIFFYLLQVEKIKDNSFFIPKIVYQNVNMNLSLFILENPNKHCMIVEM